jgi:flagellar protein FlbT
MSNLILEMRQGDMMVVNGAAIRFRNKTRIELTAHARFLFGRQIMPPDQANTPAKRIYYALQTAYIGEPAEREAGLVDAQSRIEEFKAATTSRAAAALLDQALACALSDQCYQAMRFVRRVVQHETAVFSRLTSSGEQGQQIGGVAGSTEQAACAAGNGADQAQHRIAAGVGTAEQG